MMSRYFESTSGVSDSTALSISVGAVGMSWSVAPSGLKLVPLIRFEVVYHIPDESLLAISPGSFGGDY